jgi:hypothetical protein
MTKLFCRSYAFCKHLGINGTCHNRLRFSALRLPVLVLALWLPAALAGLTAVHFLIPGTALAKGGKNKDKAGGGGGSGGKAARPGRAERPGKIDGGIAPETEGDSGGNVGANGDEGASFDAPINTAPAVALPRGHHRLDTGNLYDGNDPSDGKKSGRSGDDKAGKWGEDFGLGKKLEIGDLKKEQWDGYLSDITRDFVPEAGGAAPGTNPGDGASGTDNAPIRQTQGENPGLASEPSLPDLLKTNPAALEIDNAPSAVSGAASSGEASREDVKTSRQEEKSEARDLKEATRDARRAARENTGAEAGGSLIELLSVSPSAVELESAESGLNAESFSLDTSKPEQNESDKAQKADEKEAKQEEKEEAKALREEEKAEAKALKEAEKAARKEAKQEEKANEAEQAAQNAASASPAQAKDARGRNVDVSGVLAGTYARREVLALNLSPQGMGRARELGFQIGEAFLSQVDGPIIKLIAPEGLDAIQAQALLRQHLPAEIFHLNRLYRPYRTATTPELRTEQPDEPARLGKTTRCVDDRCYSRTAIHWQDDLGRCARDLRVGVIDTDVDLRHPTFAGQKITAQNFLPDGRQPSPNWHGTGILALLAGRRDSGTPGLIPDATFFSAGIFFTGEEGEAVTDTVSLLRALEWMDNAGVRVVNLSFSGPQDGLVATRIGRMRAQGFAFAAAAGNDGPTAAPSYPAAYPEVIAVTAVTKELKIYPSASRGPHIDLAAPGVRIWTAMPDGKEGYRTGTSFAAPYATAVLALLQPDLLRAPEIELLKVVKTVNLGPPGERNPIYGRGLLQAPGTCPKMAPAETSWAPSVVPARR